ncbi:MAG: helix-turn-helix domain-containing protein [Sphingobacteriales bacterium]|nr:MAG: helix-turn-helix domain-containing protein [Sphingobacteriales bacterium]
MGSSLFYPDHIYKSDNFHPNNINSPTNFCFEVRTLRWVLNNTSANDSPHKHDHYEIVWITKGSGILIADLSQYEINQNVIFWISPGQIHQLIADEKAEGYVFSFRSEFLFFSNNASKEEYSINTFSSFSTLILARIEDGLIDEMEEIALKIIHEFENYLLLRAEILRGLFKVFLIYLMRQWQSPDSSSLQPANSQLVEKFFNLIDKSFTTVKKVKDYARRLDITPNYLNKIVKTVSGFHASYHIQQRIILEAKRLAIYSESSMKEVAYKLGFEDPAHFSKFFKNVSGVTFTDFRRNSKIENTSQRDGGIRACAA